MGTSEKKDILTHLKMLLTGNDTGSYEILTDYFPAIIYVFDAGKNKLQYVNEHRVSDWLGYSLEDIRGWKDDVMSLVFKDDVEMVKEELARYDALKDDEDHCFNCRLNHKQGDWRHFRTRGTVLKRDASGKASSFLFIAEDITEKVRHQDELLALNRLVSDTENMLRYGSWSWDLGVDKTYWTEGMYALLGYVKEDVEAYISTEFFLKHLADADVSMLRSLIDEAMKGKPEFEYTHPLTTAAGERKIVHTTGKVSVPENGKAARIFGLTRDITEQARINNDLVHYKEMTVEKEEFLNQGSWETNLHDGTTIWTKGMYRLFGYDPETDLDSLKITNELHFKHMTEEEVARSKADWEKIIREKDSYTREATITDNIGISKQLETYGKVIRNRHGIAEKVIGTTRDVTRLREYERSLEEKIQELHKSNTELEDFAYVASHDLQEPLRKLTAFSERLQAKFSDALGKEGMLYLDRITAATENMRILIENLLEFSRTARSDKHFVNTSLSKVLHEVKADLELKIEESGTIIHSGSLPALDIIPSQIKQLFDNLIGNSIKFKRKNQACIIHFHAAVLDNTEKKSHNLRSEKKYYKIVVEDNGIGFEKEYAEKIFQIFQRLHGKADYPGSGIGLAICKKIVENHNGIIFADSHPNQGAIFTIILPENQS